jgi:hypothetical protein
MYKRRQSPCRVCHLLAPIELAMCRRKQAEAVPKPKLALREASSGPFNRDSLGLECPETVHPSLGLIVMSVSSDRLFTFS